MKTIIFAYYYLKLLFGVLLGVHKTVNPLSIRWRWNFWQHRYDARRRTYR